MTIREDVIHHRMTRAQTRIAKAARHVAEIENHITIWQRTLQDAKDELRRAECELALEQNELRQMSR